MANDPNRNPYMQDWSGLIDAAGRGYDRADPFSSGWDKGTSLQELQVGNSLLSGGTGAHKVWMGGLDVNGMPSEAGRLPYKTELDAALRDIGTLELETKNSAPRAAALSLAREQARRAAMARGLEGPLAGALENDMVERVTASHEQQRFDRLRQLLLQRTDLLQRLNQLVEADNQRKRALQASIAAQEKYGRQALIGTGLGALGGVLGGAFGGWQGAATGYNLGRSAGGLIEGGLDYAGAF